MDSSRLDTAAIWRHVDRVVASPHFKNSDRLQRFLRFALERMLDGEGAALKEYTLGVAVFDRGDDFDPRADSIVRSEARRLRQRLADYYATEGAEEQLRIDFPKGSYIPIVEARPKTIADAPTEAHWWGGRRTRLVLFGLAAATALLAVVARAPMPNVDDRVAPRALTSDTGLTFQPAISQDGSLVAYASDRAGDAGLDIWVETPGKGDPIRLTGEPGDETEPALSPDGSEIVFRASGGLYTMPSLGGPRTMIHPQGKNPRYSPDGQEIAFWTGPAWPATGKLWVIPATGGEARMLAAEFSGMRYPVWSPDGTEILAAGRETDQDAEELWRIPVAGGTPTRTGVLDRLRSEGFVSLGVWPTGSWTAEPSRVMLSAQLGDSWGLWTIRLPKHPSDPPGEVALASSGTDLQVGAVASGDGRVAFAAAKQRPFVWSLPLGANGAIEGDPAVLLNSLTSYFNVNLSADGERLAYETRRNGNLQVRLMDFRRGDDQAISDTPSHEHFSVLSRDGASVAFQRIGRGAAVQSNTVYIASGPKSEARQIGGGAGVLSDWSLDGKQLLNSRGGIWQLSVETGENTRLLKGRKLFGARFSPDDSLLVFESMDRVTRATKIFVAPYRPGVETPRDDWIEVASDEHTNTAACWSVDGRLIYFVSDRSGLPSVWAQPVETRTGAPAGEPFLVFEPRGQRLSLGNQPFQFHLSVAGRQLILPVIELTSNVWLTEIP